MPYITLRQAAELAGLSPSTLKNQVRNGRLRAVKPGHDLLTTRAWLQDYLTGRSKAGGAHRRPRPEGQSAPR
jgi:excisionase family DNA binding protein